MVISATCPVWGNYLYLEYLYIYILYKKATPVKKNQALTASFEDRDVINVGIKKYGSTLITPFYG